MISTEKHDENNYPALIEAILFVAEEPITILNLAKVLEIKPSQINKILDIMIEDYNSEKKGINLQIGPDGVQFVTSPNTASIIEYFLGLEANRRLSTAALETLAIIAYRQPVTRHIIDTIRGVDSVGAIATLRNRNLIEIKGENLKQIIWHLGNRHLPCQIEDTRILIQEDPVILDMILKLKGNVNKVFEKFKPEGGAYGMGRTHSHKH